MNNKQKVTGFHSGPFSQWASSNFTDPDTGIVYSNCEQYMMHQKALLMGDVVSATKILQVSNPGSVKALGRKIKPWSEKLWKNHRSHIVYKGNLLKFSQNPQLFDILKKTKGCILAEASPKDTIWGIGLHRSDPRVQDPKLWKGTNLLGQALMKVREKLCK